MDGDCVGRRDPVGQHGVLAAGGIGEAPVSVQLDSLRAETASLQLNDQLLADRVRRLEKMIDTRDSRWWKRLWWRVDGWPPWYQVGPRTRRFWH